MTRLLMEEPEFANTAKKIHEMDQEVVHEYVMATVLVLPLLERITLTREILCELTDVQGCTEAIRNFSSQISESMRADNEANKSRN